MWSFSESQGTEQIFSFQTLECPSFDVYVNEVSLAARNDLRSAFAELINFIAIVNKNRFELIG